MLRGTDLAAEYEAGKFQTLEREEYFRWLSDFEYSRLGLPEPDLVIYLDLPTEKAVAMLRQREEATHTKGDIHETDMEYLAACRSAAMDACAVYGWKKISCLDEAGDLRPIDDIHHEIWQVVSPLLMEKET